MLHARALARVDARVQPACSTASYVRLAISYRACKPEVIWRLAKVNRGQCCTSCQVHQSESSRQKLWIGGHGRIAAIEVAVSTLAQAVPLPAATPAARLQNRPQSVRSVEYLACSSAGGQRTHSGPGRGQHVACRTVEYRLVVEFSFARQSVKPVRRGGRAQPLFAMRMSMVYPSALLEAAATRGKSKASWSL